MELHYTLLRTLGVEKADKYYDRLLPFAIKITDDVVKKTNEYKYTHKKQKLSYVDYIGYITSRMLGIKFLTGDKEFESLEGVIFVR